MVAQSDAQEKEEVSAIELLRILWNFKVLIAAGVFVLTSLAIVYSLMAKPVFRSEALLRPVEGMSTSGGAGLGSLARQFGGLASVVGITMAPDVDEALAIIESRAFNEALLVEDEILYEIFAEQWNPDTRTWGGGEAGMIDRVRAWLTSLFQQDSDNSQSSADRQSALILELGLARFSTIRTVTLDRATGHIRITMDWKDPVLAKEWIELAVKRLNEVMRHRATQEAKRTLAFLKDKIDNERNNQLVASMGMLYQQQLEKEMLAAVREDYSLQYIDPPYVPKLKHSPRRKVIVIGTFLVSFVLLSAVALLFYAWNGARSFREPGAK